MRTFYDRLIECTAEVLETKISRQKRAIEIDRRDLETMKRALEEVKSNV